MWLQFPFLVRYKCEKIHTLLHGRKMGRFWVMKAQSQGCSCEHLGNILNREHLIYVERMKTLDTCPWDWLLQISINFSAQNALHFSF